MSRPGIAQSRTAVSRDRPRVQTGVAMVPKGSRKAQPVRTTTTSALAAAGCVAAAAVAGALVSDPRSGWYENLRKPAWQPPAPAYAIVWTPLYAMIAYAGARALSRAGTARGRFARGFLADLALNAAWTPLFFRAHRPRAALAGILCLDIANVLLIRRAWQADRAAALLLVPYAAWTLFATALNAEIARLNSGMVLSGIRSGGFLLLWRFLAVLRLLVTFVAPGLSASVAGPSPGTAPAFPSSTAGITFVE